MRDPIGYFWAAQHSQIYPELAKLAADDLVSAEPIDGPGPRPTKRYQLTAVGEQALREWLTSPIGIEPSRSEFLLRVYSTWLIEPPAARALVRGYCDKHAARLEEYEAQMANFPVAPEVSSPGFGSYAALRAGISYEQHVLSFCDWLLETLSGGYLARTTRPSSHTGASDS